jgi:plastocyanin
MHTRAAICLMMVGVIGFIAAVSSGTMTASAASREFLIVTGEWSWKAKPGEAAVVDRDRGPVSEIERYTFDPGVLVVNKGDTVALRIHTLKGSQHVVEIPDLGVPPTPVARGQEQVLTFVADKAGIFELRCTLHHNPQTEGPMVGYIYVNDR